MKAANEYAITCRTERALQAADKAVQAGGLAGNIGDLQRVVFLRDAGHIEQAASAFAARNVRARATEEQARKADQAVNQSVADLRKEREKRTGSPSCPAAR